MKKYGLSMIQIVLCMMIALMLVSGQMASAAVITVTSLADTIADDGQCTLREAVIAANTNTISGAATGECAAGEAAPAVDEISFTDLAGSPDLYTLAIAGTGEDAAATGDLDITEALTISGNSQTETIIQAGTREYRGIDRVFEVFTNATFKNVTIRHGQSLGGGGIYNNSAGAVHLLNSAVSGNFSRDDGGGIYNNGYGELTLTDSTVSGNIAGNDGGGIYNNEFGELTLSNSTISDNSTHNFGGGILNNNNAEMTLSNSTVRNNSATNGGGIYNDESTRIELTQSTVRNNSAGFGGGIYNYMPTGIELINSTVSSNSATKFGGGICHEDGELTLTSSTVSSNTAEIGGGIFSDPGTVNLNNTIVAANSSGGDCYSTGNASNGYNLDSDGSCGLGATGDISGGTANLGSLQLNAPGTTATHALLSGSDAIDAGDCSGGTITADQRGVTRPQGAACDIGAYELEPQPGSLTVIKEAAPADGTDVDFTLSGAGITPSFLLTWGSEGSDNGQFSRPYGVTVDNSGYVYVTDRNNHRIQKFDSSGAYLAQWGSEGTGDGQFQYPYGLAVDDSGYVYVTDTGNNRIQKFDSNGTFLLTWGGEGAGNGQFDRPYGVAVDGSGHVYVADYWNGRIQKFDSSGVYLAQWGGAGSGDGQFGGPFGVAVDNSGNVYVTDVVRDRVQKFDSSGTFLTKWGSQGSGDGQFYEAGGVVVDSSGYVYVTEGGNSRIQQFDSSGVYLTQWGSSGSGDGQFRSPSGVAVDSSGDVYVADMLNHRIQKFRSGFTLDDADPDDGDSVPHSSTFNDLSVGAYAITESVPDGWQLDTAGCTGGSDSGSLSGETLSVALGAGEDVTCTFTNVGQPDLTVTKTNDTDGSIDALSTFTWTITITNSGGMGATFSDGQVIFQDDLSPNGTYDSPIVGNISNVTNPANLSCIVAANVLTCVADGGEVTLEADSRFEVTLSTTAVNGPTIDNPVENGLCASDPAGLIAEADETNNDCAANSVEVWGRWVSFTKVVSGGTAEPNDFTLNIGSLLHDVPFGDIFLPDGTYTITENGPDGYIPISTDEFNCFLEGGQIVLQIGAGHDFSQCEITNEAQPGSLTIVKDANPADGTDFAFTSDIPANGAGTINTVAGDGTYGFGGDGGPATAAHLHRPTSVAVDSAGNLWIADYDNHRIRRVDASTGLISTVAGDGTAGFGGDGGPATAAQLNSPAGVAVDSAGNLWIADIFNHRIRRVDASTGLISTAAGDGTTDFGGDGGPATSANLNYPGGVAVDSAGNLWIADEGNHRIRRVDVNTGIIDTVAGDGTAGFGGDGGLATAAHLNSPTGVAVDSVGNLWIADYGNHRIRQVDASTGLISTVAGDGTTGFGGDGGPATAAHLNSPVGVAVDNTGNLWIADAENHRIRRVDAGTGYISTVAGDGTAGFGGDGGPATAAILYFPAGVAVDNVGNLWIADTYNHRIRQVVALLTSFSLDDEPVQTDAVNQSITFADISAGSYTIAETVPAGWQLDAATCTGGSDSGSLNGETLSVALGAGENVICTFTNTLYIVITPTPEPGVVPEPSTIALFGVGLLGLLALTRRTRKGRR